MKKTKIYCLVLLLLCLSGGWSYAQKTEFQKKHKKEIEKANYYFIYENYQLALPVLMDLYYYDTTQTEINYKIGVCHYYTSKNKTDGRKYFEKAKDEFIESWYYLGNIYHLYSWFDMAISAYQHYKYYYGKKEFSSDEIDYRINICQAAKTAISFPVKVNIKPFNSTINTKFADYCPILTSDETQIYFTSRRDGGTTNYRDPLGNYYEDVYYSSKNDTGWILPVNVGSPVNTSTHDACVSISGDGQSMFIYRTSQDLTSGDIYECIKLADGSWSNPEKITGELNSKQGTESSGCIAPDGITFYFSSNRPGGYGGKDLYKIVRLPNGEWSKKENLGPTINTPYDEDAPFIHADGKTIYFSSRGHKTMGGYDIFKSIQNDEGEWGEPDNIGYPINTVNDDIFFTVSPNNLTAYYSTIKDSTADMDIFSIDMPENPLNFHILKGTITTTDSSGKTVPVAATISITLIDNQTNRLQGVYKTNKQNGNFILITEPLKKYKLIVESKEFENYIELFDVPAKKNQDEILTKNISLITKKIK